jgi:hypothetical protein
VVVVVVLVALKVVPKLVVSLRVGMVDIMVLAAAAEVVEIQLV